jgi:hypothetical protein
MSMQTLLIGLGAIYLHHLRWEKKVIFTHCYKEYAINMHEDLEKNMHEDYEKFDDCSNAFIGWLRIVCEKECAASLCNIILREVDSDNVTYLDVPESFLD